MKNNVHSFQSLVYQLKKKKNTFQDSLKPIRLANFKNSFGDDTGNAKLNIFFYD